MGNTFKLVSNLNPRTRKLKTDLVIGRVRMPSRSEVTYFGSGPAGLPPTVLGRAAKALVNYDDRERGLAEHSHRSELATNIFNTSHLHKFQTTVQGSMRWRGEAKLKSAEILNTNRHICHISCSDPLLLTIS
jgi:hypothetical protein